jgi:hypothetical protein
MMRLRELLLQQKLAEAHHFLPTTLLVRIVYKRRFDRYRKAHYQWREKKQKARLLLWLTAL